MGNLLRFVLKEKREENGDAKTRGKSAGSALRAISAGVVEGLSLGGLFEFLRDGVPKDCPRRESAHRVKPLQTAVLDILESCSVGQSPSAENLRVFARSLMLPIEIRPGTFRTFYADGQDPARVGTGLLFESSYLRIVAELLHRCLTEFRSGDLYPWSAARKVPRVRYAIS